ncbi:unnamed protein product, partial [Medioppia subpectinata]
VINAYFVYTSLKWLDFGRKSLDPKLPERNQWSDKAIGELDSRRKVMAGKHFLCWDIWRPNCVYKPLFNSNIFLTLGRVLQGRYFESRVD